MKYISIDAGLQHCVIWRPKADPHMCVVGWALVFPTRERAEGYTLIYKTHMKALYYTSRCLSPRIPV